MDVGVAVIMKVDGGTVKILPAACQLWQQRFVEHAEDVDQRASRALEKFVVLCTGQAAVHRTGNAARSGGIMFRNYVTERINQNLRHREGSCTSAFPGLIPSHVSC